MDADSRRAEADVTVVVPVRNRPDELARALRSVAAQTLRPRHVLVVDDASDPDLRERTAAIAADAGALLLLNERQLGSGRSRNRAVEHAQTEWIAFLDSDDEWRPDHLAVVTAAGRTGADLVSAAALDSSGDFVGTPTRQPLALEPYRLLTRDNVVVTSTVLARRDALLRAGLFPDLPRAQDLALWLRVVESGPGVALPRVTAIYHVRSASDIAITQERNQEGLLAVLQRSAGRPWCSPTMASAVFGRIRWDQLRAAMREGRRREAAAHAAWLGRRPRALTAVVAVLHERRSRRRRTAALRAAAPRSA